MRILFISSNSSSRGGGEDFIIYLARAFNKSYIKNIFGIYSNKNYMNGFVKKIEKYTEKIIRVDYKQLSERYFRFLSSSFDIIQIFKVLKAIDNISPNLIIINQQYDEDALDIIISSFIYRLLNIFSSVKIVCIIHMPRVENKIRNQRFGYLRYISLVFIYGFLKPYFFLTSQECLEEFKKYYFLNKKNSFLLKSPLPDIKKNLNKEYSLRVINKSKIKDHEKIKLNNWVKSKRQIILIGCQMKTQKNPLFALSCWVNLRNVYKSEACLLIIGDGPLKNEISERISKLNKENIQDTLQINWVNDLSSYILISDLLLMPSAFEGMNLTLLECIAYEKEIILSNFEGISELIKFTKSWI